MKRFITVALSLALAFGSMPAFGEEGAGTFYELWTESPYLTSGISSDELNIYRAKSLNELELYPLSRLGNNYYLAICESKWTNGGYNGNSKTGRLYFYIMLVNGSDFILMSGSSVWQEYYWDRGVLINNLADKITNATWYASKGSEMPYYIIQPMGLYEHSQWIEALEYIIVTSSGKIRYVSSELDRGGETFPVAYNGILYCRADRYYANNKYNNYTTGTGAAAANMTPYLFSSGGQISYDTSSSILRALTEITTANGYTVYRDNFPSNVAPASTDFITLKSATFPDGRRVEVYFFGMGGGLNELWYRTYNPNGTLRANGPTGYVTNSYGASPLMAIALNNSKFMICVNKIGDTFTKEYYRVAVVEETITGEINPGGSIGTKHIVPPIAADTTPVESAIDFAQDNLPLGFTIKNNVISAGKLDIGLRQQVNAIRLNDIVILGKVGYASGVQNTGVPLGTLSTYDYGFGGNYIRFYTSGQNFQWYCYYPESLTPGTYNKTFTIGDKTVYVTVKVVAPPTNDGVTTVVF